MGRLIAESYTASLGENSQVNSPNPSKSVSALNEKGGTNNAPKVFGLDENLAADQEATMKIQEIPRDEWTRFFDNLSRRQEGRQVTLEVFGPDIGDQIEECDMVLAGLAAQLREEGNKIEIMMGGDASAHVTYTITAPIRVDLQQTDLGVDLVVHIKSADGTTSHLYLR